MKGTFVVVDGLDGVGKGVFIDTFVEEAKIDGKRVYDVEEFWNRFGYYPDLEKVSSYDVVLTSEPTFCGVGELIRKELTANNGRHYSTRVIAEAFSLDRRILYENFVLPLLEAGTEIYQSRSVSTSLVYQRQTAIDEGANFSVDDILELPGNKFCFSHPMDHLVIPTIGDVSELTTRLEQRQKTDDSEFEVPEFQLKLKPHYESTELRELFERNGTKVTYLDAGISLESSKQQAREFYQQNLRK
ncbi:hypothetical protein HOD05_03645 [Candidatus Woesearchaeota archaeon]|jgi:thymidylate kinase|nr:hypothetical protein [Candidatus Woesearchaeota archaeon]MBT4150646.1 hypothetical protein [Candidatus Woesearchaeota archaeon]MBT4247864.1 hypothetical protein [Candidatus Woesearchaeota archaeon]MBT4434288.1 hypothetical protein [Candidatus Woesearchaeota archaeon]MBT7331883.1 hypothetical protein [Candidatus Woesearchaeota archaeon]